MGEEEPADALPVELDNLELWEVGERLLDERIAGLDPVACIALEQRRGSLPPGPLGIACLQTVGRQVDELLVASADERRPDPESVDVDVLLPDGTRLTGTVGEVRAGTVLSVTYSRLAARHRLKAWVDLLALTVSHPEQEWRAVAVGRGSRGPARSVFAPMADEDALAVLVELVALYRAGLRSPLPMPVKTAAAYAFLRDKGNGAPAARTGAERDWLSAKYPGEQADAEHVLVYGPGAPLSVLTAARPEPGEGGPGWHRDETDRFGLLARRLWGRLLDAEVQQ
jgi:exodeoxyribonuclease V gamma subunit